MPSARRVVIAFVFVGAARAVGAEAPAAGGNPFDPSGFISDKAVETAVEASTVSGRANYRLDGKRFQRFDAGSDSVYFPLAGNKPEIREELAICPGHLPAFQEVLLIRDRLPIDAEVKKHEAEIVAIVRKCREARLSGPAVGDAPAVKVDVKAKNTGSGKPGAEARMKVDR